MATLALTLVLALASCAKKIPDGPVKEFMKGFEFNKAFNSVEYARSTVTSKHVKDGELLGQAITTTEIHKLDNSYYQYMEILIEGDYHDAVFTYDKQEVLTYGDISGEVQMSKEITDGVEKELNYTTKELKESVMGYFYKENKNDYHHGGMYYSDYITLKAPEFYQFYTVDEENKILTFSLNSLSEFDGKKVINRQNFSVNEYGMVLNLKIKTQLYDDLDTYTESTVTCSYDEFTLKDDIKVELN